VKIEKIKRSNHHESVSWMCLQSMNYV
jgi:hypothetical protein